jgi:hypothetical protein
VDPAADPALDDILRERAAHLRHMAALGRYVAEYEAEHGAFTEEEIAWAERLLDESDARLAAKTAAEQTGRGRVGAAAR